MGGNGRLRARQPPRALVLATGEEVPRGQSIRARLLIVNVAPGDVDPATLSECQRAGQQGQLAASVGGFLCWVLAITRNCNSASRHLLLYSHSDLI